MGRMENQELAALIAKALREGGYAAGGRRIELRWSEQGRPPLDAVEVYSPRALAALLQGAELEALWSAARDRGQGCRFSLTDCGSFASRLLRPCHEAAGTQAKPVLVMNFANAHTPGGGFWSGASAQEESLCRESTLIASLSSAAAGEMYAYNRAQGGPCDSDYMLISPYVLVIGDGKGRFFAEPKLAAVVTVPAPNRHGRASYLPQEAVDRVMLERLRLMLALAAVRGYKKLVLGAWGCGAFGNDPERVAGFFKELFLKENYALLFDEVEFAILGGGRNYLAFERAFAPVLAAQ